MTELLTIEEWRAKNIRFCPTCDQDTMPLRNGRCGFCERKLTEPDVGVAETPRGTCLLPSCNETFEIRGRGGQNKEYCCESHRKQAWYMTPLGQAQRERQGQRRTARKRAQRAAWRLLGLNANGRPRRDVA